MNRKANAPVRSKKPLLKLFSRTMRKGFILFPRKAYRRNLQASEGFYLWLATNHLVRPAKLWQGRVIQNRTPTATAFRFLPAFRGLNPIPNDGNGPLTSAASIVVGHAGDGFAAPPDFGDCISCSGIGTQRMGEWRFTKVRNSERFSLRESRIFEITVKDFRREDFFGRNESLNRIY